MPLLGYGGYVPFALELFVLRNLLWRGAPRVKSRGDVWTTASAIASDQISSSSDMEITRSGRGVDCR
jgi:hypothetical protein